MVPYDPAVEKRRPSFDLEAFKSVCGDPRRLRMTRTAIRDSGALGFDLSGVASVVRSMKPVHFYKSMTTNWDHRRWQDVYHVPWSGMLLYIKFTDDLVAEFHLLSFKER
ncbi:MAG TPA: type II toxin-antitoxin system MqsR family toxin [Rhizomicrobium sp.]|nr:type II toxin-antitoxin system MqsR family toxin [Rhizomicrobium sp.]